MHVYFAKKMISKGLAMMCMFSLILQIGAPLVTHAESTASQSTGCGVLTDAGPAVAAKYGGVKLDRAATFLANMDDITGAYYDSGRNVIVFVGKSNTSLPEFDKDDLAVAIRAVIFNNTNPAVSIDFKDLNNIWGYPTMKVSYYGGIEDTNFGKVLLDADLQLKRYFIGYDESGNEIHSNVPGYQSVLKRWVAAGPDLSKSSIARWWISPKQITLKKDDTNDTFVFDTVQMQVETEPLAANNDPAWNKAASDFAAHQTQYYDSFAAEVPAYAKAKQLGKIVSVIKWIKDNQVQTDYEWAKTYQPTFVPTPREVPRITSPNVWAGNYYYYMTGGVQYATPNSYIADTGGSAAQLKSASLAAAPASNDTISWTFTSNGQTYNSVAVSADLFKSVGAYGYSATDISLPTVTKTSFALTRSYSSFATDKNIGFGSGWNFMPATLTNVLPWTSVSCSISGGYSGLYPYNLAATTQGGRETFTFNCGIGYSADDPSYHSKIARAANGTFTVTTKDRLSYIFASSAVESEFPLLTIADANNASGVNWTYNANNTVSAITDVPSNTSITFTYNTAGQISNVSAPSGTVQYSYDASDDLVSVTDPRGNATRYSYDPGHLLKSITDRAGTKIIDNTYAAAGGRVVSQTDARSVTRTIQYNDVDRAVSWSDPSGRTGRQFYDVKARVLKTIDPQSASTTYAYGPTSNAPMAITDALGRTTVIAYDTVGNPTTITMPDGGKIQNTWDSVNNLIQMNDQRYVNAGGAAKVTTNQYDASGNLTQTNVAGITTTTFTYTPQGKVASITDSNGGVTRLTYNTSGLPTSVQDPLGKTTAYAYNAAGRLTSITDPNGVITSFTYDSNGNKLSSATPVSTTRYAYDANDRPVSITDSINAVSAFSYDPAGSLVSVADPLGSMTRYAYDSYGNLTKTTNALLRDTTFSYDSLDRETSYHTPMGKTWTQQYDALGNIVAATLPSGTPQSATYDTLNRLASANIGGSTFAYTYDSASRLTKIIGPSGTTTYAYDIKDRLLQTTDPFGNTVKYQYDAIDNLTRITYPDSKVVLYAYDAAGRLAQQTDWNGGITSYAYTPVGALAQITYPNGIIKSYTYDSANRLLTITYKNASQNVLFQQAYERDARGFITKTVESGANPTTQTMTYQYDLAGRLTRAASDATVTATASSTTFTASGTWKAPAGVTSVTAEAWGSGGGGGGSYTRYKASGGGGGGAYAKKNTVTVVPGTSYTATVGAGGNAGASNQNGAAGGDSWFKSTTDILAKGGGGGLRGTLSNGAGGAGGLGSTSIGDIKYSGGNGAAGTGSSPGGGGGGGAGSTGSGGAASGATGGMGTALGGGNGGTGGSSNIGNPGLLSGGGGGGGSTSRAGGKGAPGKVVISYTIASGPSNLINETYTYDSIGNMIALGKGIATTTYTYSPDDELLSTAGPGIAYTYDANGNLSGASGATAKSFAWHPQGLLASATSGTATTSFSYDADGNRVAKSVITTSGTGSAGNTGFKAPSAYGLVLNEWQTPANAYASDNVYSVATMPSVGPNYSEQDYYNFNVSIPSGSTIKGIEATIEGIGNRLSQFMAMKLSYNNGGNFTSTKTTSTFSIRTEETKTLGGPTDTWGRTWSPSDFENAKFLVRAWNSSSAGSYSVNIDQIRVKIYYTLPAEVRTDTRYVNDVLASNALVLAETDSTNAALRTNVWGPSGLVSTGGTATTSRIYAITDSQGSVRLLTDSTGAIVRSNTYTPYGTVTTSGTSAESPYLYTGENLDPETNLIYLRARYYDPATGRFISRDPVRGILTNPMTQNPYIYAAGNPMMYSDPSGEFIPLLLLGWAAVELGLTAWDIYDAVQTVSDDCASAEDRALAVTLAAAGFVLPGGGYGKADDVAKFIGNKMKQVAPRGWTLESIQQTISSPYTTRKATNKANGNSATVYYTKDGAYIVKDDVTGQIVQVSNKNKVDWKPDSSIVDPYTP